MSKNLFQKKEFVAGAVFIVFDIFVLIFGAWFFTKKIIDSNNQLAKTQLEIQAIQDNSREVPRQRQEFRVLWQENLDKIDQAFLSPDQPIDFIKSLEDLAQRTNNLYEVSLVALPAAEKEKAKANYLLFQIALGGSFVDFMHFLKYLENMPYLTSVQTIQISKMTGQGIPARPEWKNLPPGSVYSVINLQAPTK